MIRTRARTANEFRALSPMERRSYGHKINQLIERLDSTCHDLLESISDSDDIFGQDKVMARRLVVARFHHEISLVLRKDGLFEHHCEWLQDKS